MALLLGPGARVERADSNGVVSLTYDDGRLTWDAAVAGDDLPEPGTRLLIEHWGDDPVSLYQPEQDRRYRTDFWPKPWDVGEGVLPAVFGFLLLSPLIAALAVGITVRVRAPRARRAA